MPLEQQAVAPSPLAGEGWGGGVHDYTTGARGFVTPAPPWPLFNLENPS